MILNYDISRKHLRQNLLKTLQLTCAPSKTKMGLLRSRGFHFLGLNFTVNLCPDVSTQQGIVVKETKTQISSPQFHVEVTLHERGCVRAMDNIKLKEAGAESPAEVQLYLARPAAWWSHTLLNIRREACLKRWLLRAQAKQPELAWIALGLLRPALAYPGFCSSSLSTQT